MLFSKCKLTMIFSTRFMDPTSGNDPKAELDKALFQQMQNLANKRRQITKEKVI